jgi:hypothetical protein
MMEREILVSPEKLWGDKFRVPAIIGLGSGSGYRFSNLHLPIGWQEQIPNLRQISKEGFSELLGIECRNFSLTPVNIRFDSKTNILTEITVKTESETANLYLDAPSYGNGVYRGENVRNLAAAIVLHKTAARFLNQVNSKNQYSYIDGKRGSFFSVDLNVPEEFLKSKERLTTDLWQYRFEVEASNIAGRFGESLARLEFNDIGILQSFELKDGNATNYHFSDLISGYSSNNVDRLSQAAALHGIGASFINGLLDIDETKI